MLDEQMHFSNEVQFILNKMPDVQEIPAWDFTVSQRTSTDIPAYSYSDGDTREYMDSYYPTQCKKTPLYKQIINLETSDPDSIVIDGQNYMGNVYCTYNYTRYTVPPFNSETVSINEIEFKSKPWHPYVFVLNDEKDGWEQYDVQHQTSKLHYEGPDAFLNYQHGMEYGKQKNITLKGEIDPEQYLDEYLSGEESAYAPILSLTNWLTFDNTGYAPYDESIPIVKFYVSELCRAEI